MNRKPISKRTRQLVYAKYNGHCAYCGCELDIKDMQVDHANITFGRMYYGMSPEKATEEMEKDSINSLDNLMPSCRQCNYYKGIGNIEQFRQKMKDILSESCRRSFQVRLAMKYGILTYSEWDGLFYFEREKGE